MATKTRSNRTVPLPTIGRQGPTGSAKKTSAATKARPSGKPNGSILNFFKKTDSSDAGDGGLFVEDRKRSEVDTLDVDNNECSPSRAGSGVDEARFHERGNAVKRRKTHDVHHASLRGEEAVEGLLAGVSNKTPESCDRMQGPFIEDSDSEDEDGQPEATTTIQQEAGSEGLQTMAEPTVAELLPGDSEWEEERIGGVMQPSTLIKQETSCGLSLIHISEPTRPY